MGLKRAIKLLMVRLIEPVLKQIEFNRAQARRNELDAAAVYDPATVRVEATARIANNRGQRSFITIGDNSWIQGQLMILKHGGEIHIGENCFVGEMTRIWSSVSVNIGNNVLISHNVNIHDNISHPLDSALRHQDFLHVKSIGLQERMDIGEQAITIGNNAWIGFNATILKGVNIGEGAIVGANTVVTKDVPPFAVIVGNPPRIVKYTT